MSDLGKLHICLDETDLDKVGVDYEVEVVFDALPNSQDRQLLESYQRQGDQFNYEYVNPYDDPRKAQEFGATQTGSVYLDTGETQQFLQNVSPEERLSERVITNAGSRQCPGGTGLCR